MKYLLWIHCNDTCLLSSPDRAVMVFDSREEVDKYASKIKDIQHDYTIQEVTF